MNIFDVISVISVLVDILMSGAHMYHMKGP